MTKKATPFFIMNMNDINVDDEFDALSTGMDDEEEEEEEIDENEKENQAILKQLEEEMDEEENQKAKPSENAWKANYSNQETPEPSLPLPQPIPQQIPQKNPQQVIQQVPQQMPQQVPQQMPQQKQQMPQQVPQQMPQQVPQQMTPQAPQKISQQPVQQKQQAQGIQQQPPKNPPQNVKKEKPAPKPKPKPAPPRDFVDEKASSDKYNDLFETFTDSFYSMLHSKSNQKVYLEQIEKLLPIIAQGPSQKINDDLDLVQPKLKAPAHRKYEEFKKKPISTALSQKEVDKVISELEEQIETLKKDTKTLLANNCKKFAMFVMREIKALRYSIAKIKEAPYYVSDIFHYFLPDVNENIPQNVLRVKITNGSGFPKDDIIIAILVPTKEESFFRVATPCVKGPNPNFNFQQDIPINNIRNPNVFKRFHTTPSSIGVYLNVGKEIPKDSTPKAVSTVLTNHLMRHHTFTCPAVTFEDIPGAMLNIEFYVHHAIAQTEMKPTDIRVKISPSVIFARKTKKQAATEAQQKSSVNAAAKQSSQAKKQATANSAAHKVQQPAPAQQPKAEMRSQQEIKKNLPIPQIYVFTEEELNMFWSGNVAMFICETCEKVMKIAELKKVPPQDGVPQMRTRLLNNWKKIESAIQEEKLSQEQYMEMVKKAIAREEARLPSIPQKDRETHEGFISAMKSELQDMQEE